MPPSKESCVGRLEERLASLTEDSSPADFQAAAGWVAEFRTHYVFDGRPDWHGESPECRAALLELYAEAGIPADGVAATRAKLRYHLGRAVRDAQARHRPGV